MTEVNVPEVNGGPVLSEGAPAAGNPVLSDGAPAGSVISEGAPSGSGPELSGGAPAGPRHGKTSKEKKAGAKPAKVNKKQNGEKTILKSTLEGMQAKKEDFANWYKEVITKGELIEYYDVKGCYILRPRSYAIWEAIVAKVDVEIKKMGVENCYFPLFVTASRLEKEKDHIDGFQEEVAWVTKKGKSDLEEKLAVRPTSETIIYPAFSKWIRSHRDLPIRINQWSNVVRWEMSHCTPFLRSREFLWQEGHTAFETKEEADAEVLQILYLYKNVYEQVLAVPVIQGRKSEGEKFAGALYTTTVEGFIPASGRAIQGGTSHCLGQNFSRKSLFDISFVNDEKKEGYVWQNSWGLTTRTIGVMIMVHGDDLGLVLPPRSTRLKAVIIPIVVRGKEDMVKAEAEKLGKELMEQGLKVKVDARMDKTPGWKFNRYELLGVPLRIELGPKDIEKGQAVVVRRDTRKKETLEREGLAQSIDGILEGMQNDMLVAATNVLLERVKSCNDWTEFMQALEARCLALAPWCTAIECEEEIKKQSTKDSEKEVTAQKTTTAPGGKETEKEDPAETEQLSGSAKSLCIPFESELKRLGIENTSVDGKKCFKCQMPAAQLALFGRSY